MWFFLKIKSYLMIWKWITLWKVLTIFFFSNLRNFAAKNLCDETSKIKNLRWLFRRFFRWLRPAVFHYLCRCCFHREICKTKLPLFQISRKTWKNLILNVKFAPPLNVCRNFLLKPIFMSDPCWTFSTPEFLPTAI